MIFLDTGFVFALVCRRDENHERVRAVMNEYRGRDLQQLVLTSNHVVEETITLVRSSVHRDPGVAHDIAVDVGIGRGKATVWTCDLTHGYININGDYRS